MARLRLSSGSFWPAALMHASHNVVIQSVLDKATIATPLINWWTGEFGAGLVLTISLVAWILTRSPPRADFYAISEVNQVPGVRT
jgi:CAAX protease family protein